MIYRVDQQISVPWTKPRAKAAVENCRRKWEPPARFLPRCVTRSLARMFIDSRTLPENTEVQGDVCIIGAGAAGITLALDLASGNRRIVVFESGGFAFSPAAQRLYCGGAD